MKPIIPTFSDPKPQPSFIELIALAAKGGEQAVAEALNVSPDEGGRILAQDPIPVIPSERQRAEESPKIPAGIELIP